MNLYAWQPNGHGEMSFFVCAECEEVARKAVEAEIARRLAIDYDDDENFAHFSSSDIRGWGTSYYTLTVVPPGTVVCNNND